ncbi:MAG: dipeptide/oligopeptide/nickel ABC transporter ATP-binding protein [Puniceicoccales bacterium]|jgi:ABC-type dipeptide/oligopeptide/nickel transport system ATPase subunit|nr:dipeptide/oligopeptide/nickel ABC transporter ATP-binding protein [Puniceicoccales bacterium]
MDDFAIVTRRLGASYAHQSSFFRKKMECPWVLHDISLCIKMGECLGIIGNSGCGKSTLARILARLQRFQCGSVEYFGKKNFPNDQFRSQIQLIPQSPIDALDPLWSVRQTLEEPLSIHFPKMKKFAKEDAIHRLLENVSLDHSHLPRFPRQLSGGQRQRVAIARALAVRPKVLICDEITSALDVAVQWDVLRLLRRLADEYGLTILFISHDIAAVARVADRMAVMHGGTIVETGLSEKICSNPCSVYTKRLMEDACHIHGNCHYDEKKF